MDWLLQLGMPRGACFAWDYTSKLIYIGSALALFFAYSQFSWSCWHALRLRTILAHDRRMLCGFILFFFLCGIGHLVDDVMAFYYPAYRVMAFTKFATAATSLYTALRMPGFLADLSIRYQRIDCETKSTQAKPRAGV